MSQDPRMDEDSNMQFTDPVTADRRTVMAAALAMGAFGLFPHASAAATGTAPSRGEDVVVGASKCVVAGELCAAHCLRLIQAGDPTLAACMNSAMVMTSVCRTMMTLAAVDSPVFKQMGAVAMATCEECRAECEKHAAHHAECNACMVACKETLAVLQSSVLMKA